ncbi:hypothetical protein SAMN05421688_0860 [Poseidonocella pacifica]|uniref:LysM domain-containing protein n=1 Tax=Poseidonocella pacifica TaxID=871651 RepID=A0A1I0VRY0_9RHOB|nr:hypothetical protein [Poseidonocella pacifica]SFA78436.1 hypothetical protein SAMN05421688_0860 [Poseidonocella pacifica]
MFRSTSRYANLPTVPAIGADGQEVMAVKLRVLPDTRGVPRMVRSGNLLDVMAHELFGDGTRFWHIADANTELEANTLVARDGRVIRVPEN